MTYEIKNIRTKRLGARFYSLTFWQSFWSGILSGIISGVIVVVITSSFFLNWCKQLPRAIVEAQILTMPDGTKVYRWQNFRVIERKDGKIEMYPITSPKERNDW